MIMPLLYGMRNPHAPGGEEDEKMFESYKKPDMVKEDVDLMEKTLALWESPERMAALGEYVQNSVKNIKRYGMLRESVGRGDNEKLGLEMLFGSHGRIA